MTITKRQKEVLFAIIEEYAETAAPVGSVTLAKLFGVSSATIRSEMAKLEEVGLLVQPHTSAGRVPTDSGYRLYVNSLTENMNSANPSANQGASQSTLNPGTLNQANSLPESSLTSFSRLLSDGRAERESHAIKLRIESQKRADFAIRGAVDSLVELTGNLGLATIGDQLYLAGMSRLFTQPEFMDTARVQSVAKLLDNLEPWLREAAPGEPLNIFIGEENPIGKTSEVSLIISKFRSPYSDNSYIGVLGPTRQNYGRVMSLVRRAGNMLEEVCNA